LETTQPQKHALSLTRISKAIQGGRGEELTDGSKHLCRREAFVLIRLKPEAEGK
jgi:hypothetical protein